jgi:hypothetical protein
VGFGLYASVYGNDKSPYVYKIMTDNEEAESYRAFIVSAMKRQNNPWLPKIYSAIVYHPERSDPYLVVKMERLKSMAEHPIANMAHNLHYFKRHKLLVPYRGAHLNDLLGLLTYLFGKFGNDLHNDNIMMRESTGHPVITDPVN